MNSVTTETPPWFRAWVASKIRENVTSYEIREMLRPVCSTVRPSLVGMYVSFLEKLEKFSRSIAYTDFDTFHTLALSDTKYAYDHDVVSTEWARARTREIYDRMVGDNFCPQSLILQELQERFDPDFDEALKKAYAKYSVLKMLHAAKTTFEFKEDDDVCIRTRHGVDILDDLVDGDKEVFGASDQSRFSKGPVLDDMVLPIPYGRSHRLSRRRPREGSVPPSRPISSNWKATLCLTSRPTFKARDPVWAHFSGFRFADQ